MKKLLLILVISAFTVLSRTTVSAQYGRQTVQMRIISTDGEVGEALTTPIELFYYNNYLLEKCWSETGVDFRDKSGEDNPLNSQIPSYYLIDKEKGICVHYTSFSDTATPSAPIALSDKKEGISFQTHAQNEVTTYATDLPLTDTSLHKQKYKLLKLKLLKSPYAEVIHYLGPKTTEPIYRLTKQIDQDYNGTVMRMDVLGGISIQMDYTPGGLSEKELAVFNKLIQDNGWTLK